METSSFSSLPIGAYKLGMCSLRNGVTVLLMSVGDMLTKREESESVSPGWCLPCQCFSLFNPGADSVLPILDTTSVEL